MPRISTKKAEMKFSEFLQYNTSYIVLLSHVHTHTVHDYIITIIERRSNDDSLSQCTLYMYSQSDRSAEHMTIERKKKKIRGAHGLEIGPHLSFSL